MEDELKELAALKCGDVVLVPFTLCDSKDGDRVVLIHEEDRGGVLCNVYMTALPTDISRTVINKVNVNILLTKR